MKTARESVASATNSAADAIREVGSVGIETVSRLGSDYAKLLPDSANVLENVKGNLTELFKAQPLALGAIGLAIGAGIAAALPHTEIENSYLGETSDTVRSKAAAIAGEQMDTVATAASNVVDAAKDGARKEGLTLDDTKAVMDGLSGKLGRVVDAAGKSLSENLR